jgi:hypothetical protein
MALRDLQAVVYTDDEGHQWATAIDAAVFAQRNEDDVPIVGGADYTGSPALEPLPRGLLPRAVYVQRGGNRRKVVCLTADADLYTAAATSVSLQVLGTAAESYTRLRAKREADHRKFRNPAG